MPVNHRSRLYALIFILGLGAHPAHSASPLSFEANQGQAPIGDYLSRGPGYYLSLTATEATFTLQKSKSEPERVSVRMQLVGANPRAPVSAADELAGRVNYIAGESSAQWHMNIPMYAKVKYEGVYPRVDVVYYGNSQRQLEYDFHVAPGADPATIKLQFAGADSLEVDPAGELVLHTAAGELRQHRPIVYQERAGARQTVTGAYVVTGAHEVGFVIGEYDASRPLVIDPTIAYSTFLGGISGDPYSHIDKDEGNDIAVDAAGNIYVVGSTNSLGRYDTDVFVRKFDPSGSTLLYETFLDSNGTHDVGLGVAVDPAGNAYVTGQFGDPMLPGFGLGVLVAKLSPKGIPLYKVAFGAGGRGYSQDYGVRIAADDAGNAYIVGTTYPYGTPFPTTAGAFQRQPAGGFSDAFVVKLNPSGGFVYSTLLGSSGTDQGTSIAIRKVGSVYRAYVTGVSSLASDFPTTLGAFQRTFGGASDVFVSELNETGSALVYSTYLGGNGRDEAHGIAVDAEGNAYLTGWTSKEALDSVSRFPIINAFQPIYGGQGGATPAEANAFVSKLNPTGSALVFSSYMGGGGYELYDIGIAIKVDAAGNAYLTGITGTETDIFTGAHFPVVNAFQRQRATSNYNDAFVAKVGPHGALIYSSYLGGRYTDEGHGIAVGASGDVWITGVTNSEDFAITPDAYQPQISGGGCTNTFQCGDAFVVKIADGFAPSDLFVSSLAAPSASAAGATVTVTETTKNQGGSSASASTTKFYLSANATFGAGDVLLGSRAAPTLAAGASNIGSTALLIPASTPAGSYYLLARADADGVVAETNESNNTRAKALSLGPDLVVSALVAPASGGAGTKITVSNTAKNQGGGGARTSTTKFYLSTNTTFGVGDVLLGSRAVPALVAGASSSASTVLTVPIGTARGSYFLLAVSDATKLVAEARENNNVRSKALTIL